MLKNDYLYYNDFANEYYIKDIKSINIVVGITYFVSKIE